MEREQEGRQKWRINLTWNDMTRMVSKLEWKLSPFHVKPGAYRLSQWQLQQYFRAIQRKMKTLTFFIRDRCWLIVMYDGDILAGAVKLTRETVTYQQRERPLTATKEAVAGPAPVVPCISIYEWQQHKSHADDSNLTS